MKRIFTLILTTAVIVSGIYAQVGVPALKTAKLSDENSIQFKKVIAQHSLNKTNGTNTGWFNYINALTSSGYGTISSTGGYAPNLMPDSLAIVGSISAGTFSKFNVDMHGVGVVWDPKSDAYNTDPFKVNRYTKYTVDSIRLTQLYRRWNPNASAIDTLIIQLYTSGTGGGISKSYLIDVDSPNIATANFDVANNYGKLSQRTIKILLGPGDTSTFVDKYIAVSPPLSYLGSAIVGATFTYAPALSANLGDTLTSDTLILASVKKKLNQFRVFFASETSSYRESDSKKSNPVPTIDRIWQNSLMIISETKYGIFSGWKGEYWPGDLYNNTHYHLDADIHINATNVGINAAAKEYLKDVQVYPNPSNGANAVTVEYKLTKTAYVSIDIVNLLGKKVSSVNVGKTEVGTQSQSLNVSELANGIYFANIYVDGIAQTVKFTVTK
ncbi:MAG: T9SS type A sorting domain-containing protein [Bacteroidetes bacterium]|nr:T9SS type A sorting domain-containing protein [Bacteroidota bacterium]